jgi:chemotaxis protein histidine kinase CheA
VSWSDDVRERIEQTLHDLETMLAGAEDTERNEQRLGDVVQRWAALDVRAWTPGSAREEQDAPQAESPSFREFAAAELDAMVAVLGTSILALGGDPGDREALKRILRQQRTLLGAARLEELPMVAETLRAIEDVSRIIVRINVPIKDEWLDVYRCGRTVLENAAPAIARGENPPHTTALSRLRTYRQELLDRYGSAEEQHANPPAAEELLHAHAAAAAKPAADPSVDIQNLMYTGEAALRRALDLRARLERAVEHDPDALALVDEVFDLIRLGLQ